MLYMLIIPSDSAPRLSSNSPVACPLFLRDASLISPHYGQKVYGERLRNNGPALSFSSFPFQPHDRAANRLFGVVFWALLCPDFARIACAIILEYLP